MLSKRERIKEIADEVRNTVIPTEIIPVSHKIGKNYTNVCPYHGGKKKGNFMVSNEKKIFKCFNCGAGGDVIRFYADHHNINYAQGALELAERYNIITRTEFEDLTVRALNKKDVVAIENHFQRKDKNKEIDLKRNEKADDRILDEIYNLFIKSIELSGKDRLSEEHLKYLKGRCEDKQIEEVKYFTFPTRHIRKNFLKLLEENNYKPSVLKKIPGFYFDEKKEEYTFATSKSIGIPIRNEFGQIIAIQRRYDQVEEGHSRYRWLTSSFSEYGCSPGAPIEVIYPKEVKNNTLFITEGHFKGYRLANTFNSPTLSVPGVQSWRNVVDKVEILLKNFKNLLPKEIKHIFIAFDSDMSSNLGVLGTAISLGNALAEKINSEGGNVQITFLVWNVELGKGIDDFLDNGFSPKEDLFKVKLDDMIKYSYDYVKHLVEKDKELLKNLYNEDSTSEKEILAKSIYAMSTKYWKIFKDIEDEEKEREFNNYVLKKLF